MGVNNLATAFLYCSYSLSNIESKSLTRIMRDEGLKTASIRSSAINSHYWNLQEGVDVSIENSTIDLIPYHLKKIIEQYKDNINTVFIDIDTLHGDPYITKMRV